MRIIEDFSDEQAFEIHNPQDHLLPFIFNSPHSGCRFPASFIASSQLDVPTIRRSEDAFVDALFMPVVALGAPLMRAHFPRAFLDVNREPYELDPRMFSGAIPTYANSRSLRVAGGLGTIARIACDGKEIYASPIPIEEGLHRIETIYKPYHKKLSSLVARTHAKFGYAVLFDCHSMPSTSPQNRTVQRPDFIIGDRFHTSCPKFLIDEIYIFLTGLGYRVVLNKPYAGGYITEHYGRPAKGLYAVQIEINRGLYLNEAQLKIHDNFSQLSDHLMKLIEHLSTIEPSDFAQYPDAAE